MTVTATTRDATIEPREVHETLGRHLLVDGFRLVLDTAKSHGSWLVDARTGESYLDMYTFFASAPLGLNHPEVVCDSDFMKLSGAEAKNVYMSR